MLHFVLQKHRGLESVRPLTPEEKLEKQILLKEPAVEKTNVNMTAGLEHSEREVTLNAAQHRETSSPLTEALKRSTQEVHTDKHNIT